MMDHSMRTYDFKKYDLVVGKNIDCGEAYLTFIGIVTRCTENKVDLAVVWCNNIGLNVHDKPWFVGDEIGFESTRSYCMNSHKFYNNITPIGDLSFPWDIPGHYPIGGVCFDSGRRAFEAAKKASKIADMDQFKDLLAYVRINVENGSKRDISHAINDFYTEFGWSDHANMFLQGLHADRREFKSGKGRVQPLIFI